MPNNYGFLTKREMDLFVGEVCAHFDGLPIIGDHYNQKYLNAYNLMMETLATETHLGEYEDTDPNNGMGLPQIDHIKYIDIIENGMEHRKSVWNKWHVDMKLVSYDALRYGGELSIIFMRLGYKRFEEQIPSTGNGRKDYWKKWWNTYKGKGSTNHYLAMSLKYLGEEI